MDTVMQISQVPGKVEFRAFPMCNGKPCQTVDWPWSLSGFFLKHKFSLDVPSRKVWGSELPFILCCCLEATQPKLGISMEFLQNGQNLLWFVCSVNVHFDKNSKGGRQRRMLPSLTFISWITLLLWVTEHGGNRMDLEGGLS